MLGCLWELVSRASKTHVVAKGISELDFFIDQINSLNATDAANLAAPYSNGSPPPDHQVDMGTKAVEEVIKTFAEEKVTSAVHAALLGNGVEARLANQTAQSVGIVLSGLMIAKMLNIPSSGFWRCDGCGSVIVGYRFQCRPCSARLGGSFDMVCSIINIGR